MKRILILYAHPAAHQSLVNQALIKAVTELDNVLVHDLYQNYPDFFIDFDYEQNLLREHDIVVFHHPIYWYSCPALLKEWQDVVLQRGFAYGNGGTALHGKYLVQTVSSGGREQAYCRDGSSHFTLNELLRPFEQTACLCGMTYLPPFWIAGTHYLQPVQIAERVNAYREHIITLRDNSTLTPYSSL